MRDGLVSSPALNSLVLPDGARRHGTGRDLDEGSGAALALFAVVPPPAADVSRLVLQPASVKVETAANLFENLSLRRVKLALIIPPPALHDPVAPQPASASVAAADLDEISTQGSALTPVVSAPALHAAVFHDTAGVELAGGNLGEKTFGDCRGLGGADGLAKILEISRVRLTSSP